MPSPQKGSAFVSCKRSDLDRVFAVQEDRTLNNDNTVQYGRTRFQLSPSELRISFAKCRVRVYEHLNGTLSIGYGPHTLGRFKATGHALHANGRAAEKQDRITQNRTVH
jgi:hypothetical protein